MPKVISAQQAAGPSGGARLLLKLECGHTEKRPGKLAKAPKSAMCWRCSLAKPVVGVPALRRLKLRGAKRKK